MDNNDVIFYISDKRIGAIRPDGSDERYLEFPVPGQAYWQMGMIFRDERRAILWSQEPPRNPNANFDDKDGLKFATTHLWLYDFELQRPRELGLPPMMGVIGEMPGDRLLVSGNTDSETLLFTCDLDGGQRDMIYTGPGFAYGTTLSPDGRSVAFHITNVPGRNIYEIYVIDIASKGRILIASDPDLLNFGPTWSPDGQWLLYQRCAFRDDPGHDHSDICISRTDGSETRLLTTGQRHWFGTSYGPADNRGGGSNVPAWSPDGKWITFTRCTPGAQTAWVFQTDRPDTDHFNREYRPDLARGGADLCLISPESDEVITVARGEYPTWNFRAFWSPDSARLVFARADVGQSPGLWVVDIASGKEHFLTRGYHDRGADHCRWVRLKGL